jgi:hypothetical protein
LFSVLDPVSGQGLTLAADGVSQVPQLTESSTDFIFAATASWMVRILPFPDWFLNYVQVYLLQKFIFRVLYSDQ